MSHLLYRSNRFCVESESETAELSLRHIPLAGWRSRSSKALFRGPGWLTKRLFDNLTVMENHLTAIFVCVIAGLSAQCLSQAPQTQAPKGASVPMLECTGFPCIDVQVSGTQHLKMLVDTGNANSILTTSKARELGLDLAPAAGPDGKPYPGIFTAMLKDVKIGSGSLGDLTVVVLDLQADMSKGTVPMADGTLAYTAFHDRSLALDYRNHRIGMSDGQGPDTMDIRYCGDMTTPTFGEHGPPIVVTTGFAVNDKPLTVQIDTLYGGTMLVYSSSVAKLGLDEEASSKKIRQFPFTDGGVEMIEGTVAAESFFSIVLGKRVPVYFATPKVHQPNGMFDGTVGNELFRSHLLYLDFLKHHVCLA
jgi:Aspartyl protease